MKLYLFILQTINLYHLISSKEISNATTLSPPLLIIFQEGISLSNIILIIKMQKIKLVSKDALRYPSPNITKNNKNSPPHSQIKQSDRSISFPIVDPYKQISQLKLKISSLERQLQKSQEQAMEFKELAQKNKRLEEQMQLILQQLQKQHQTQSDQYPPTFEQNPDNLEENIMELQRNIQNAVYKYQELENSLKNNLKKDITTVQQRILDYVFKLENKINLLQNISIFEDKQNLRKQSSLVSMMNLQIEKELPTHKNHCLQCQEYANQISYLKSEFSLRKSIDTEGILEKIKIMESNIDIAIDSSHDEESKDHSSQFENKYFLEDLKQQLNSVKKSMNFIENVNANYEDIHTKMNEKDLEISELQSQKRNLFFQVQEKQKQIEKLQKLLKFQANKYEENMGSSYRKNPMISCVNHEQTKSKIEHILSSMKKLENQWEARLIS